MTCHELSASSVEVVAVLDVVAFVGTHSVASPPQTERAMNPATGSAIEQVLSVHYSERACTVGSVDPGRGSECTLTEWPVIA